MHFYAIAFISLKHSQKKRYKFHFHFTSEKIWRLFNSNISIQGLDLFKKSSAIEYWIAMQTFLKDECWVEFDDDDDLPLVWH